MLNENIKIALSAGRIAGHLAWEAVSLPRYTSANQVPRSAEAITPEWLTDVLCRKIPGAKVLAVECSGGSDGTSSRRSIKVTYNDVGVKAGLPDRLFSKASPFFRSRLTLGPTGKLANETGFYNRVRPLLDIEAPETLYAGYHPASARSMILFEDLAIARGYHFCDPSFYVNRAMAEDMVKLIATYHGRMWQSPLLAKVPTTLVYQLQINNAMAFSDRAAVGMKRAAGFIPEALAQADHSKLWSAHMRSLEINSQSPMTLQHWDMHIGNWYVTADGRMGLSDWGMVRGQWASDFTYAILSALTIEDRRAWENDLLKIYLVRLVECGGIAPSFADAQLAVRQQVMHPLFYWLVTLGAGPLQPSMQPPVICKTNVERIAQGFVDLDPLGSLI